MPPVSDVARAAPRAALWALGGVAAAWAAFQPFDPLDDAKVPRLLSQTGIYADILAKTPDTALKPFELNAPLWSDGARKQRWIVLPPGQKVPYDDTADLFAFPQGTVFVKNFLLDTVEGEPSSAIHWETRLLVRGMTAEGDLPQWHGFSYRWNRGGTDANLVEGGGLDTLLFVRRGAARTYVKWRFPSRTDCAECHRPAVDATREGRGVLGFFPPQLKRPDAAQPSLNQVDRLFNQGVFSGTRPGPAELARRWKGIHEAIPAGLHPDERFRVLDTIARSYIGGNCSGCHGGRSLAHLDFDFFRLRPETELGAKESLFASLFGYMEDGVLKFGDDGLKYRFALRQAGADTAPGGPWEMSQPADGIPRLVRAGHVAVSSILYRQWVRNTPAADSVAARLAESAKPAAERRSWLFEAPWGSAAWEAALARHGVSPASVLASEPDPAQMPPLASYRPDTAALRLLGEWVKSYRTVMRVPGADSVTRIARRGGLPPAPRAAFIRDRVLVTPVDWRGSARLIDATGRARTLAPAGPGRFLIPASATPGVHVFEVGGRRFRAVILRSSPQ